MGELARGPTLPGMMPFRMSISTAPHPQGTGRVGLLTHPYKIIACAAAVVTGSAGRDRTARAIGITGTEEHAS